MSNWIKEIESRPIVDKALINWPYTTEFEIQGKYFVDFIVASTKQLSSADDKTLMNIAMRCSNILGWINQMHVMGFTSLGGYVEDILREELGDAKSIEKLLRESLALWLRDKRGQHLIGENYLTVVDENFYYRKLSGVWLRVSIHEIFGVFPEGQVVSDALILAKLHASYKNTPYDALYDEWQKLDTGKEINEYLLNEVSGISSPESILDDSMRKIKLLIGEELPSLDRLIGMHPDGLEFVERTIKISLIMSRYVQERRLHKEHTVYLLRDCVMFNELHHALDIIEGRRTSHDQLYIGRKILSNEKREGGHWYIAQEILLLSYLACPNNFDEFYNDYREKMDDFERSTGSFSLLVKDLTPYIKKHAVKDSKLPIRIVDLGFQGSINMLLKYIIENHFGQIHNNNVDVHMFVVAEWFKSVYGVERYGDRCYELLTIIEATARNEYLYDYNPGGFKDDGLTVKMGTSPNQLVASLELIISVVTAQLAYKLGLI